MAVKNILLPVNDSIHSQHAVEAAIELADKHGAHVTLLSTFDIDSSVAHELCTRMESCETHISDKARRILDAYRQQLKDAKVCVRDQIVEGEPEKVISEMADSGKFDLVILGSEEQSPLARLFGGSVSNRVANSVRPPVMLVH